MEQKKQKVSFDIDTDTLSDIKSLCQSRNTRVADFYRDAVREKLDREKDYITIFYLKEGVIEKETIRKEDYKLVIFEATKKMKDNAGAINEGILSFKKGGKGGTNKNMDKNLSLEQINFFTKQRYT